ncbi:MAG: hypothetical protein ABI703_04570 [Gemmatimonadales bacterium]
MIRWATLIALVLQLGCSNLTDTGGVVELEISQPAQTQIEVGQTLQLTARALDKDGNPVSVPISWRAADHTLTVNDQGLITGVSPGPGRVQACVGSLCSALISLTVVAPAAPAPSVSHPH